MPARQFVAPFAVVGEPAAAFARLRALVARAPRTEIVRSLARRFDATCRTRLGFVDDLAFRLCPERGVIHVRSASRLGYHDLGVNRSRVEALRREFDAAGRTAPEAAP